MNDADYTALDATAMAGLVATRQVAPIELVRAAIAHIEQINPTLNAVIHPRFELALKDATSAPHGLLHGVPFLVKDLMCATAGDPYHAGSRYLKNIGYRASHDTFLAARYRAAGLLFVGRTNTPEFGLVTTTEPLAYGPTHNPWSLAYSPGGSSGGSAAAVASGMVPAAHANDGGGSIRIPAAHCGLLGLKPSRGRVSHGPSRGDVWLGAAIEHVVTRSVRDSAALLDIAAGPHAGDPCPREVPTRPYHETYRYAPPRLRIGLLIKVPRAVAPLDPACRAAAENAARALEALGHVVTEAYPQALDEVDEQHAFMKVLSAWLAHDLAELETLGGRPLREDELEPANAAVRERGLQLPAAEYVRAQVYLQGWARRVVAWWDEGFDLLLSPTTAAPPPLLGSARSTADNPLAPLRATLPYMAYTAPFNVTGQPAASIPFGETQASLPVGIQLVAAPGREDLLLQVAHQLECHRPWAQRRPRLAP